MEKTEDEFIATCSACGSDFDETEINMIDYEIDLCVKCEAVENRKQLIKRNENLIQMPMPDLSKMTNAQLEKRATIIENAFEMAYSETYDKDINGEYL